MVVVSVFAGSAGLQVEEVAVANSTDYVIAVDHGYLLAQAVGCRIDEVVGDMDSLAPFKVAEAAAAGAPPHWLAYISTPDIGDTVAKATDMGATIMAEMEIPTVGSIAVIADPQGAVFTA